MLVTAARSTLVEDVELIDVREHAHAGAANGPANGPDYGAERVEYDVASALIIYEEYHPFGTSAYRAVDSTIEVSAKRYRYAAAERDEETGLDHMGARYYAPWLGRWTSADPIGLGDGVNRYAYVHGNPVSMRDPGGTFAEHTVKSPERPTAAPEGAGEGSWVKVGAYTTVRENGPGESGSIWEWRSSEAEDPIAARERALGVRPGSLREQAAFERREMQRMRTEAAAQRADAREAIANQETAEAAGRILRTTAPVVGAAEAGARVLAPGVTTAVDVIDALLSDDPEDRAQAALGLAQSALEKRFPFLRMRRLGEGKQSEALTESKQKALPATSESLPPARETPALGPASDAGSGGQNATRTGVRLRRINGGDRGGGSCASGSEGRNARIARLSRRTRPVTEPRRPTSRGSRDAWEGCVWVQRRLGPVRAHTDPSTSCRDDDAMQVQLGVNNPICPGGGGRGGARAP